MSDRVGGYTGIKPGGYTLGDPPVGIYEGTKPGGARMDSEKVGG
jgi:hypothetical protein